MKTLSVAPGSFLKKLCTLLIAGSLIGGALPAQEVIKPFVAPAFGKPVIVQAEFVGKSNTYYAQNMVTEPYALKVLTVDGKRLPEPVLIEYDLALEKKERSKIERPGKVVTLEAYETLYQPITATPWLPDGMQGSAFALVHRLYVRPPQSKHQD